MENSNEKNMVGREAVFVKSTESLKNRQPVKGYNFDNGLNYDELFSSMKGWGFQATNFGYAVDEINNMIETKFSKSPETSHFNETGCRTNCTIFLGYTSNLASSGLRDTVRFLAQHHMVDVIVSSAGGIEEDFIKVLGPTYIGDFRIDGRELRRKGINRIGNLLISNDNYCLFESWIIPIFTQMLKEQKENNVKWTPSKLIHRLGKEINDPSSIYYWCYKNNIPVFSPAITDGSLGDALHFFSCNNPEFVIDIVEDVRKINQISIASQNTGMIILGGGLIKHHICNSNLMRNGANYSVFVNVASEFDGSDSGARPDEAISWGKIKMDATPIKIYCEFTLVFPLLVAQTFYKHRELFKG